MTIQFGGGRGTATDRRQFLKGAAKVACAVSAMATIPGAAVPRVVPQIGARLRPPGAAAAFFEACTGCGACVAACPPQALRLVREPGGPAAGLAAFVARETPCAMCDGAPCATACPTGALDRHLAVTDRIRIGLAALVDEAGCLNHRGLRCDVCHDACPLSGNAITLSESRVGGGASRFLPAIDPRYCTGCGQCEKACVLETPAIRVQPLTA